MEDLFSTSKTNWLELETDVAKTTNAAIEEVQKKNAEIFAMAIAEAKRAEEQRSKNYQNLQKLIGQAPKTIKSLQEAFSLLGILLIRVLTLGPKILDVN